MYTSAIDTAGISVTYVDTAPGGTTVNYTLCGSNSASALKAYERSLIGTEVGP
jgi:hypothetical protein